MFALLRDTPGSGEQVLCLHNMSEHAQQVEISRRTEGLERVTRLTDLIGGGSMPVSVGVTFKVALAPYQVRWLSLDY